MERVVQIPEDVNIEINGMKVSVSGKLGKLERDFFSPLFKEIKIEKRDGKILISGGKRRKVKSMIGTIGAHIKNMIEGVRKGYECKLKIVYMHFPISVKIEGNEVLIQNFLGERTTRKAKIVDNVNVEVKGDEIIVSGIDKESVGLTAARIEQATRIKAKDRRIYQDGIWITSKPYPRE